VKYRPYPNLAEASALRFNSRKAAIPVPKIYCAFHRKVWTYIFMQRIQGEALDNFYLLKEFHVLQRRKLSTHGGEKEHCLTLVSPIRSVKQLSRGSKVHQLAGRTPSLQATTKRKIDSINNESSAVDQYPRKKDHSAAPPPYERSSHTISAA
jgi:hypothetical protein